MKLRVHSVGATALLLFAAGLNAQSTDPTTGTAGVEAGGIADVAIQGYYFGGSGQPLSSLNGAAVAVREFIPGLGLLTANAEGYQQDTRGRLGDNFVRLNGFMWKGRKWNATVGDFKVASNLVPFPFLNYFNPVISLRGASVEMADGTRTWTVFGGEVTLSGGPRITFRTAVPQTVIGATVKQKVGLIDVGARYLHTDSPESASADNPAFFPTGREFHTTDSLQLSAYYNVSKRLKLYSDATLTHVRMDDGYPVPPSAPLSWLSGATWETAGFSAKVNYGSQGTAYFPVLGVFAGDRRGPYGEAHYKPFRWIDLTGTASQSRNNIEGNTALPTLHSVSYSAGGTLFLPSRFSLSGQESIVTLSAVDMADATQSQSSHNTETSVTLTRPFGRHNIRLAARQLRLNSTLLREKISTAEVEDGVQFGRFTASGAVRFQQANAGTLGNSLFFRGNVQARFGRFSVYGQAEFGNDLVNQSVFSTNTVHTTLAGVSVAAFKGWTLQAEAFRNSLNSVLNAENAFLLATQGTAVSTVLADLNQWNAYIRLSKRLQWGAPLPEAADHFTFEQTQLFGTVEGFVRKDPANGLTGVAEIEVSLDGNRTSVTDVSGRYRFDDVIEGPHEAFLAMDSLPAEFSPGEHARVPVLVKARKTQRADLDVAPIGSSITGSVDGGEAVAKREIQLSGVVVTLNPGNRETTCDDRGKFAFFNLPAGEYRVTVDGTTLPEFWVVTSDKEVAVQVSANGQSPIPHFIIEKREPQLPIRKVFGGQAALVR